MNSVDPVEPTPIPYKRVLVTGGHGFIGSYMAKALFESGDFDLVRIVDTQPKPSIFQGVKISHDFIMGDLHDPFVLQSSLMNVELVLHFAANMGGMGTIHSQNDFDIYSDNHAMTLELLRSCVAGDVKGFFYASSACVYPEHLQQPGEDVSLRERDVFATSNKGGEPPRPQGLYGLEKLNTELVLAQFSSSLNIRIARFHNVYGPGGTYMGGREKAPAALLRKAAALSLLSPSDIAQHPEIMRLELWGDGKQKRSFLYIDDAVDAILRLLRSSYTAPLNIGSDQSISVQELANIALNCGGLDSKAVEIRARDDRPVGVGARNSNNELVTAILGWRPTITIVEGMKRTYDWIKSEVTQQVESFEPDDSRRLAFIEQLQTSDVVNLSSSTISFAILLPITSRSSTSLPEACLENLRRFALSLAETTRNDLILGRPGNGGAPRFALRVYLAVDHDDNFLLKNKPGNVLRELGFPHVETIVCDHPKGHVCALWRDCARKAWEDRCDYYVLFGDDVVLQDEGWTGKIHIEFLEIANDRGVPHGVGCVAFTDSTFPGMPTFPVIHRRHMDTFEGEVIPDIFINQDGDPFLFQLYRRWNCSRMVSCRLSNAIGGDNDARYQKKHAKGWTFGTLDKAVTRVAARMDSSVAQAVTLDIVIPCYRVDLTILSSILNLTAPPGLSVMFIIIVDDPNSPNIPHLEKLFGHRVEVRIRVNKTNLGASASRNRGMLEESAADWVHFLDDDIVPDPNLLLEDEKIIRAHPNAAGFVGNCQFPNASTVFQAAVHLTGVTYFWDIATKMDTDLPWGVTANLVVRRKDDGVVFDLRYPKTGGGEDIDFCRQKREASMKKGGGWFEPAPNVIVTHPWWSGGKRSYWRFYMWSFGDGALVTRFPALTYRDWALNTPEALALSLVVYLGSVACQFSTVGVLASSEKLILAVLGLVLANVVHDLYRHLVRHPERMSELKLHPSFERGPWLWISLVESTFIRMFSECGRMRGILARKEWGAVHRRFDWFAWRYGSGPSYEERRNNLERMVVWVVLLIVVMSSA
ncbi:hypothetical protein NMY22_g5488 [Coprinellus aureogranulatus]|nr:hypothetical protein NMY22_g5488 [Coprinellus aureogranulatus]